MLPDAAAAPPLLQARREAALQRVDLHEGDEALLLRTVHQELRAAAEDAQLPPEPRVLHDL